MGQVRALMRGPCNTYLGRLEANLDQLRRVLEFLDSGFFARKIIDRIAD